MLDWWDSLSISDKIALVSVLVAIVGVLGTWFRKWGNPIDIKITQGNNGTTNVSNIGSNDNFIGKKSRVRPQQKLMRFSNLLVLIGIITIPILIFYWYQPSSTSSHTLRLVMPSILENVSIKVDEKPAVIIDKTPTITTIRVPEKETNHRIVISDDIRTCIKEQRVLENQTLILNLDDCKQILEKYEAS